jgi:hypothetical protein
MATRCLGAALLATALTAGLATAAEKDDFRPLFNGKDLDGWVVEGDKEFKDGDVKKPVWVVEDGLLRCQTLGRTYGFLRYAKQEFSDFVFRTEYRFYPPANPKAARGNSGVGIRTVPYDPKRIDSRPSAAAYEVQLLDDADRPPDKHSTASLYNYVAPTENAAKAAPAWNAIEIRCVGPQITIVLNGVKVLDVDQGKVPEIKDKPLKGYVCLQNHGSRIDFRNVWIKEIVRPEK